MKQDCQECRRLEKLLEEAAVHYFDTVNYVESLDDADPQKVWVQRALRGATAAKDEAQQQFNEHVAKHAREEVTVA